MKRHWKRASAEDAASYGIGVGEQLQARFLVPAHRNHGFIGTDLAD